jgi:hypothetical protein
MPWQMLFKTDNDVRLLSLWRKDTGRQHGNRGFYAVDGREGVCGGMSAMWLKNMFNARDVDCKPDPHASARIHVNSEFFNNQSAETWNQNVLELAGLSVVTYERLPHVDAINRIMSANGSYYISTGNHAMAAVKRNSSYYFFEPATGALKTEDRDTFYRLAGELHVAYLMIPRYTIRWAIIKVKEA